LLSVNACRICSTVWMGIAASLDPFVVGTSVVEAARRTAGSR
jgi:hypothetical protein